MVLTMACSTQSPLLSRPTLTCGLSARAESALPLAAFASGPEPPSELDWQRRSARAARVSIISPATLSPSPSNPVPWLRVSAAAAMICETAAPSPVATKLSA